MSNAPSSNPSFTSTHDLSRLNAAYLLPSDRIEFQQLLDLIGKCRGTGQDEGFTRLLSHIKTFLRQSDAHVALGVELLLTKLKDVHAVVRLNMVHVIDCIFMRSKIFRACLLDSFHTFLELTAGIGPNASLLTPRPPEKAKELQITSIGMIRNWNDAYGEALTLLRIGHTYMQSRVGGLHVPSRRETEEAAETSRAVRRARTQQLLQVKYQRLTQEFESNMTELEGVMAEINNSLEILFPQANQSAFNEFLLQDTNSTQSTSNNDSTLKNDLQEEPSTTAEDPRPTKRLKTDPSDSLSSFAAAAASSHNTAAASTSAAAAAAASPTAPSSHSPLTATSTFNADVDEIEWETEATLAAPHSSSSSSTIASTTVDPATAALIEHSTASDSHWWLDEQLEEDDYSGSSEYDDDDDYQVEEQESKINDEEEQKHPSGPDAHVLHGLGNRNYTLQIEFDSNFGGTVETPENKLLFDTIRDGWTRIQKSFLIILNEWIDTLTRVEFHDPNSTTPSLSTEALQLQRDRYLLRSLEKREMLEALLQKCKKLNITISTLTADRNEVVRRATESTITNELNGDAATPTSSSTTTAAAATATATAPPYRAPSLTNPDPLVHQRHASRLLASRARAEQRAVKKIRAVKRKHAKLLELERAERRNNPQAAEAYAAAQRLKRPFSGTSTNTNSK